MLRSAGVLLALADLFPAASVAGPAQGAPPSTHPVLFWTIVLLALAGLGLVALLRQVQRRSRALAESERRARDARARLSVLLDHAPVALWTVDRDLRITWAEGRGLVDLGRDDGDLVGTTIPDLFGPDHQAPEAYRRALAGEPARFDVEWGGRLWEVRLQPLREEGEITGIVGAALDATGHREAERRLEEQSAYFQKLFEEAPEAIVLVDEDDRVLQVNPEFEAMFGYTGDEVVGRLVNELISVPGREKEATDLTRRVASGERLQVETIRRHKDGTEIDVSILATPLEVGGRRRVYGIYRDITERRALEAQLLHSQRLEAVGQLAGGVAHDFNNILTAILGHARVLLEDLEDGDGRREDLRQIVIAGERAAQLTRQLLTFSRRDMASPRSVDLNTVIRDTRAFLGRLIEERIELAVELADGLPPVRADPGQLEQIVVNLVLNARDAMPGGGQVTLSTRHVDGTAPRGAGGSVGKPAAGASSEVETDASGWIVLAVRDAGQGMSPDERARMFEPFFTTKGPGEGTGLGLSTVYGIVEQAGGFIDVDTSPGVGTTVSVHLPACTEGPARSAAPSGAGLGDPSDGPVPRAEELVLLVDDDRPVRDVARRILERAGYRVVALGSGGAALDHCDRSGLVPDAVVTDIVMPGMTGYELANRLRERFPGIRVLLMTGYTEEEPGQHGEYPEILRKPFDAATLVARLRDALATS